MKNRNYELTTGDAIWLCAHIAGLLLVLTVMIPDVLDAFFPNILSLALWRIVSLSTVYLLMCRTARFIENSKGLSPLT